MSCTSPLDVGCGRGGFAKALRARDPDIELWGLDCDPDASAEAAAVFDHFILGEYPRCLDQFACSFDCIVMNDVLEHMTDPWGALHATPPILDAGGTVVASVPNLRYLPVLKRLVARGRFDYEDAGVLDRNHLRFFTKATLRDAFIDAGFAVTRLEPINTFSSWHNGYEADDRATNLVLDLQDLAACCRRGVVDPRPTCRAMPASAARRAPLVLRARAAAVSAPPGVAIDDGAPPA
jgi:2-polyprenyl-3-methyl-5-hydroxy-6-metoxy-1,4-benzoquinol methylase